MKQALLVHGWAHKDEYYDPQYPTLSNSHWFPWLSKQLMIRDIHAVALEMPQAYYPVYDIWKTEFERYQVGPETTLIGHSCGAGFLVRWLSENSGTRVGKVVLIAPWMGIDPDQDFDSTFFAFDIDRALARRTNGLVIFNSDNDESEIHASVKLLKENLEGIEYQEFSDKGHFTLRGMGSEAFPELLEELVQ